MIHRFFLAAYIVKVVMSGAREDARTFHPSPHHAKPLSVTADYPKKGVCIYNMEGYNSNGVHQESTGIIIDGNMPGRNGDLKLQFNTLADGPEGTSIKLASLNISGKLNLDAEIDGVYTWWNPGGRDINYDSGDTFVTIVVMDLFKELSSIGLAYCSTGLVINSFKLGVLGVVWRVWLFCRSFDSHESDWLWLIIRRLIAMYRGYSLVEDDGLSSTIVGVDGDVAEVNSAIYFDTPDGLDGKGDTIQFLRIGVV
ncbi:hypothetical protein FOZ60_006809, partial [Perkinsus olseni]